MGTVENDGRTLDKVKVTALSVTYNLVPKPNAEVKVTVDKSDLKIASSEGMIPVRPPGGPHRRKPTVNRITGDMTLNVNGTDFPTKLDLTMDRRK